MPNIITKRKVLMSSSKRFVGLLDLYPSAAAAFSLRKLKNSYLGSAIRVRRSTDNAEQDIGFTSTGMLDTAAMLAFCGAGDGFVTTWYDQSGNAKNGTQATALNQPTIVSNGAIITENGKPTVSFNGTTNVLNTTSVLTASFNITALANTSLIPDTRVVFGNRDSVDQRAYIGASLNEYVLAGVANVTSALVTTVEYKNVVASINVNGLSSEVYINQVLDLGASNNAVVNTTHGASIGALNSIGTNGALWSGTIQEIVAFGTEQSSNMIGIHANIMDFYGL